MIHIALCEDNAPDAHRLRGWLEEYPLYGTQFSIHCTDNPRQLLMDIEEDHRQFDIICLDIVMPGMDGLEAAARIRAFDQFVPIIFTSVYKKQEYLLRGYEAHAFDYIVKPYGRERLYISLDSLMQRLEAKKERFVCRFRGGTHQIPLHTILYFEKEYRSVIVHTADSQIRVHMTLRSVEQACGRDFLYLNRYVLANRHHIQSVHPKTRDVILTNGDIHQASTARYPEIRSLLLEGMQNE